MIKSATKAANAWKSFHKRKEIDGTTLLSKAGLWPKRFVLAGRCVVTYYSSDKWQKDRTFFERYYHDHNKKTNIYLPEDMRSKFSWLSSTPVPAKWNKRPESAAILGYALGFDIKHGDEEGKLQPDKGSLLICNPEKTVLYVVEGGRVRALVCAPKLRVEARGVVG
jgi:hypothetical protein